MAIETDAGQINAGGPLNTMASPKDKLVNDIKAVMADAQELLKKAKTSGSESYSVMRTELEERLSESIARLQDLQGELKVRASSAAKATDAYVRDNPWKSVGYVAVAGLIVGLLISRSR
jgi:ElaB/YqjD/DUF883 family membrane-anchored ribosome-binding protein